MKFIDLHTHTFYSDGVLVPSELVYRCKLAGYEAVAIADHVDYTNYKFAVGVIKESAPKLSSRYDIEVLAGAEITYVSPEDIGGMVETLRTNGADIVVVHGETPAEYVPPGTNLSAVKAGCDILAHPGNITAELAELAAKNGVYLELTTRQGHKETNYIVAERALKAGAKLVINTDTHAPGDILSKKKVEEILNVCGFQKDYYNILL
ncbi:MAG: histidinol phosphate phosphatase domain-containing protein, partial [Elusimicrobia bacterium]|nr:histidinol phosphate phosphatase domain-containing protein [Elusimicrobiota bacterium]